MFNRSTRRLLIALAGLLALLAGIAGLFLPILPGVALLAVGIGLLAREFVVAERMVRRWAPRRVHGILLGHPRTEAADGESRRQSGTGDAPVGG